LTQLAGVVVYLGSLHVGLRWLGSRRWLGVVLLTTIAGFLLSSVPSLAQDTAVHWDWEVASAITALVGVLVLAAAFQWVPAPAGALCCALAINWLLGKLVFAIYMVTKYDAQIGTVLFDKPLASGAQLAGTAVVALCIVAVHRRLSPRGLGTGRLAPSSNLTVARP
jgi:hypothetical protein